MKSLGRILLTGFAAAAVLAACTAKATLVPTGVPGTGATTQATQQPTSGPTSPPATSGPSGTPATQSPSLVSLIQVEDLFERASAGEVPPAVADALIKNGQTQWNATTRALVQPAWLADGGSQTEIDLTDGAITAAVASIGTPSEHRAANTVTQFLSTFYEACGSKVPNELGVLDAIGRNIILDGIDLNWTQGNLDVISLKTTWAQVRAEVVLKTGGPAAAATYDADITTVAADVAAKIQLATQNDTSNMQNDFDALETVF